MPATFYDAVRVTRSLGLRYLWIDSLCIIQDDEDDWARESVKMGSIYESAALVIAASKSPSPMVSFLSDSHDVDAEMLERKLTRGDGSQYMFRARPSIDIAQSEEPLDTRAWTWQEHRLARRLIRFTSSELSWACRTDIHGECSTGYSGTTHNIMNMLLWGRFCSDYVAGLWRDDLVHNLGWQTSLSLLEESSVTPSSESTTQPAFRFMSSRAMSTYRAPSFSWASLNGEAAEYRDVYLPKESSVHARVLDAQCSLKGLNHFGEVTDGYIVLETYTSPVNVSVLGDGSDAEVGLFKIECNGISRASQDQVLKDFVGTVLCALLYGNEEQEVALILGRSQTVPGAFERLGIAYSNLSDGSWFDSSRTEAFRIV
ncbi:heterokaryon incompatibility protein-domain-containing protein [Xylariaceae sp. FL0255]|nr:heterokaryon incompatibility protein-domain-containing protein [Xylariaceae sp. FL0255]